MSATAQILDRARSLMGLTSDNQLAHALGWRQGTVSNYRRGARLMEARQVWEFSKATGISTDDVLAAVIADSEIKAANRQAVSKKAA